MSQLTPTGTTCTQFVNGTAETQSILNYSVSNGKVAQNVTPGVFFYWVMVTAPAGSNTFTITQTITTGNFTGLFDFHSGSNVFTSNCGSVHATITQNPATGAVTAQFNAPTAGTYIISIKYQTKSIVGDPAPTGVPQPFTTTSRRRACLVRPVGSISSKTNRSDRANKFTISRHASPRGGASHTHPITNAPPVTSARGSQGFRAEATASQMK